MRDKQTDQVLEALKQGPLTALSALTLLGVGRLAARVWDLRQDGENIQSKMVTVTKADGSKAKVKMYWWEPDYELLASRV